MKSERFRVFEPIDGDDNPKDIKRQLKMHNDMLVTLTQMDKEADALEEKLKEANATIKQLEKDKALLEKENEKLSLNLVNTSSGKDTNESSYKILVEELKKAIASERASREALEKRLTEDKIMMASLMEKMNHEPAVMTTKQKPSLGWQLNVTAHNAEGEIKSVDIIPKRKQSMN
jgi:septal ring factor EnvC (AmiA/AmiB activator)